MKLGIGLPNTIPGTPGDRLVEWGVRAEAAGFAGLATLDRINYPGHDSLATLAAVAGATTRIGLMTNILLAPNYPAVLLARSAATIDQISGGRLTLGLAPGGREDDYELTGVDFHKRGEVFDALLETVHKAWAGEPLLGDLAATAGAFAEGRVPILIGGTSEATLRRVTRWGAGWTAGGAAAARAAEFAEKVRATWKDAGRTGDPRLSGLQYFSLGDDVESDSRANLRHYYAFTGSYADMIADGALRSPEAIRTAVQAFADAGFTELYLDPTSSSIDQVDRLADAVL